MGKRIVVFIVSVLVVCLVFMSALAATDPTTPIDLELFSMDYPVSCFMAISEISVEHSNDAGCKALNKFVDTKNEKQHVTISSPIYDIKGDSSFSVRFRTKNEKTCLVLYRDGEYQSTLTSTSSNTALKNYTSEYILLRVGTTGTYYLFSPTGFSETSSFVYEPVGFSADALDLQKVNEYFESINISPETSWTMKDEKEHTRANAQGQTETEAHVWQEWQNEQNGSRTRSCSKCEAAQTCTTHDYDVWVLSSDSHSRVCLRCGKEEKANHTYRILPKDKDTHERICNDCGQSDVSVHICEKWYSDGDGTHSGTCVCGAAISGEHQWRSWQDSSDESRTRSCSECNTTQTCTKHDFGDWIISSTTHSHICSICRKEESASHTFTRTEKNDENTHKLICETCGQGKSVNHSWSTWQSVSDSSHSRSCICGETQTANHSWGEVDSDSTQHKQSCSVCHVTISGNHTYDDWTKFSDLQHKRRCTFPGCDATETKNHEWSNITSDNNEKHSMTCSICGTDRSENHKRTSTWNTSDENVHTAICDVCLQTISEDHNWDYNYLNSETHSRTCWNCKREDTAPHRFATAVKYESYHTYRCLDCEREIKSDHEFAVKEITDSLHIMSCIACSQEKKEEHNWSGWTTAATVHQKECRTCHKSETENHVFEDYTANSDDSSKHTSTCSCGQAKTEPHNWGKWQKGTADHTHRCLDCAAEESLPHSYKWTSYDLNEHRGTCDTCGTTTAGYHRFGDPEQFDELDHRSVCADCGQDNLASHAWSKWEKQDDTTHVHSCACGETAAEEHLWGDGVVTKAPTSAEEGKRSFSCTRCTATRTEIIPKIRSIQRPVLEKNEFTFIEEEQTVLSSTADYAVTGGRVYEPGDYTVLVSLRDKVATCWDDGSTDDLRIPCRVVMRKVTIPVFERTQFACTGTPIRLLETTEDYWVFGGEATYAGDYTMTVRLKDGGTHRVWEDGTKNDLVVTYSIVGRKVTIPEITMPSRPYTGKEQTFLTDTADYRVGNSTATEVGTYYAVLHLNDTNMTIWEDNTLEAKYIPYQITKNTVTRPAAPKAPIPYNGQPQTIIAPTEFYTVSGGEAKEIGDYTMTVSLIDPERYVWDNGTTEALVYPYSISGALVAKPTIAEPSLIYNGQPQIFLADGTGYHVSGGIQTEAGTYKVTASLLDPAGTRWADGTADELTFTCTIIPKPIAAPAAPEAKRTYNGQLQVILTDGESFTVSGGAATDAGDYTMTVSLKDEKNTCWANGRSGALTFTYTVSPLPIPMPVLEKTELDHTGMVQTILPDTADYTVSGGTAAEPGEYTAIVTLKDAKNTCWTDGTTEPLQLSWRITEKEAVPTEAIPMKCLNQNAIIEELSFTPEQLRGYIPDDALEALLLGEATASLYLQVVFGKPEGNDGQLISAMLEGNETLAFMNIDLYLNVSKAKETTTYLLEESPVPLAISVFIPKMLQNMGGTYRVIRAHEGKAQELASTVEDAKITFSTALFSTYALVVKVDMPNMTPAPVNPGGTTVPGGSSGSGMLPGTPGGGAYVPTVPKTGDESWVLQAVLMLLGALSMMMWMHMRKKNH